MIMSTIATCAVIVGICWLLWKPISFIIQVATSARTALREMERRYGKSDRGGE
tara:strand:- start:377 stop:535 length:159 start_codon:yes stop_codon:yes gene_type:complete